MIDFVNGFLLPDISVGGTIQIQYDIMVNMSRSITDKNSFCCVQKEKAWGVITSHDNKVRSGTVEFIDKNGKQEMYFKY